VKFLLDVSVYLESLDGLEYCTWNPRSWIWVWDLGPGSWVLDPRSRIWVSALGFEIRRIYSRGVWKTPAGALPVPPPNSLWLQSRAFWASGAWIRRILPPDRFQRPWGLTWEPRRRIRKAPRDCLLARPPGSQGARIETLAAKEPGSDGAKHSQGAREPDS